MAAATMGRMVKAVLPKGFSVRSATVEDADVITDLINETTRAEIGIPWTTLEDIRSELTAPGREPETDDAIMLDADGVPSGYLQLWGDVAPYDEILALAYVRPRWWGRGVSTFLLRLGEERARAKVDRAPPDRRVVFHVARFANVTAAAALFEKLGFSHVRTFWVMQADLELEPPSPGDPVGITIRGFDQARDTRRLHEALAEAFSDHWGHPFPSFEQWRHFSIEGPDFDPELWFVATDANEIVGAVCGRPWRGRDIGTAVVEELAVRRAWRRRGIALALLTTEFRAFQRRGLQRAELSVDAESPTGATRLYERAGMHVAHSWERWEKELRPGEPVRCNARGAHA
jgi:mycothiol synthase